MNPEFEHSPNWRRAARIRAIVGPQHSTVRSRLSWKRRQHALTRFAHRIVAGSDAVWHSGWARMTMTEPQ